MIEGTLRSGLFLLARLLRRIARGIAGLSPLRGKIGKLEAGEHVARLVLDLLLHLFEREDAVRLLDAG